MGRGELVVTPITFVTGAARSGTSLTTSVLIRLGAWPGPAPRINSLYENVGIRQHILKPYLVRAGGDDVGQRRLPNTASLPPFPTLRQEVEDYLAGGGDAPRVYKDAKLCLVWPTFVRAFPEARWIIVRRDAERIVDSCMRTSFMNGYRTREGWRDWLKAHERRFDDMRHAALNLIEVWPKDFIEDPEAFRPAAEIAGLDFVPSAVTAEVKAGLFRD